MSATASEIDGINHVGVAVHDMHAASQRLEAIGFTLTPFSAHAGAWKPGQAVGPMGSGNRCVMFKRNYLEVLAHANPDRPNTRITRFLSHHEGAHIICFNAPDVHAVDQRLASAGVLTSGVIPLQRDVRTPEGERTAKFERTQFAPESTPEGYIQAARHLTPQYVYQPRYMAHSNGAVALIETILIGEDVDALASRYRRYTGIEPGRVGSISSFHFADGSRLTVATPSDAETLIPGSPLPPLPGIAGVVYSVADRERVRRRLAEHGLAFSEHGSRLMISAEASLGVAMLFEPA